MMKVIKATIIAKKGTKNCAKNHKIGDEFIIDEKTPKKPLCCSAFNVIWPSVRALLSQKNAGINFVCCPDPEVLMEFELKTIYQS